MGRRQLQATQVFKNKVVLITGASSGIGEALACEFASQGADLALCARREDRLVKLAKELSATGTQVLTFACDVNLEKDLQNAVQVTREKLGHIDVVVANAGFGVSGDLDELKVEDYRFQFETNVFGVLNTIYATIDDLKKSKGTLALLGSVAGYVGVAGGSAYCMSKFAVHALAQFLTLELYPHGVAVVQISPGFVESEIQRVDNKGVFHERTHDHKPSWLEMPRQVAAKKIVRAIARRKRIEVITLHAKVIVFFQRHFPWLVHFFAKWQGLKNRPEPGV